jgi:hypothetical protein
MYVYRPTSISCTYVAKVLSTAQSKGQSNVKKRRKTEIRVLKSFKADWKRQSNTLNLISLDYVTSLFVGLSEILETMTFGIRLLFVILLKVVLDSGVMPTLLFTNI